MAFPHLFRGPISAANLGPLLQQLQPLLDKSPGATTGLRLRRSTGDFIVDFMVLSWETHGKIMLKHW